MDVCNFPFIYDVIYACRLQKHCIYLDEISLILNGNYNCNHWKIDSIRFDIKMLSFYIYFP